MNEHMNHDESSLSVFSYPFLIFTDPIRVFRSINERPGWLFTLILFICVSMAVQYEASRHIDYEATIIQQLESSGKTLSEDELQKAVSRAEKASQFGWLTAFVFIPLYLILLSAFYHVGVKLSGGESEYPKTFSTVLHSYWPGTLFKSILLILLLYRRGLIPAQEIETIVRSNLAVFLSPEAPKWLASGLAVFDIFNLWTFLLLGVGLSETSQLSRKTSYLLVGVLWAIYINLKMGFMALISGVF